MSCLCCILACVKHVFIFSCAVQQRPFQVKRLSSREENLPAWTSRQLCMGTNCNTYVSCFCCLLYLPFFTQALKFKLKFLDHPNLPHMPPCVLAFYTPLSQQLWLLNILILYHVSTCWAFHSSIDVIKPRLKKERKGVCQCLYGYPFLVTTVLTWMKLPSVTTTCCGFSPSPWSRAQRRKCGGQEYPVLWARFIPLQRGRFVSTARYGSVRRQVPGKIRKSPVAPSWRSLPVKHGGIAQRLAPSCIDYSVTNFLRVPYIFVKYHLLVFFVN